MSDDSSKNQGDPKRRLRLMNEVLPAPDRASASPPRTRTMANMNRLLAIAALGAACTKEGSSNTIKPDEATKPKPTSEPTATATATTVTTVEDTAPSTTATTSGTATSPTAGYLVVDMLPPPAKCAGSAATITPTAAWKSSAGGALAIEIRLRKPARPDAFYSKKSAPTAYSATIVGTAFTGGEIVVTIIPDKGATYAGLYVPLECKAGDERLNVEIDLSSIATKPPSSGTAVKVSLYDGY